MPSNKLQQRRNPAGYAQKLPEHVHLHWHISDLKKMPSELMWNANTALVNDSSQKIKQADQMPYDESLLEKARMQWQFGDWESLMKLERDTLQHHPDRAKLALLVAAGHMQQGDTHVARQFVRLAQDWGCSKKLISQILIAGVHNSLGRAAAASGQENRAIRHFESSISVVMPKSDIRLLGQARIMRETAKLGLLPQAARLMEEELFAMKRTPALTASRLKIFETELELLHHELSLAQQRQQIFRASAAETPTAPVEGTLAWIDRLKNKSVSQLGQDLWVLEKSSYKHNGYFVEFGATDGVLLNNTWLLEKEFHWQGICAEPNPKFFAQLKQNRQCLISDAYIGSETAKQVEFILADVYGGNQKYANDDHHGDKREAYRSAGDVVTLTSISLNDFLKQHNAPREIDYLSVDTEGSEFEILENFPFDQWHIRLLTVEHNFTKQRAKIRALLERNGYICKEREWDDWYELKGN